ncbi:hypothetical protein PBY51_011237 [Eleginops maclovinus]|nr:hypothetical protein PBY51_011237 [Eleginops maclovinus]
MFVSVEHFTSVTLKAFVLVLSDSLLPRDLASDYRRDSSGRVIVWTGSLISVPQFSWWRGSPELQREDGRDL